MRGIGSPFWVATLATAACVAAAGCGGEDDSSANGGSGLSSAPARFLGGILTDVAKAKSSKDCRDVAAANRRSTYVMVCPPVTPEQRKSVRRIELLRAERFGNAALIDYRSPAARKVAQAFLYRDEEGLWTLARMGVVSEGGSIGTSDEDGDEDARATVDRYLSAIRDRDCEDFDRHAVTSGAELGKVCDQEFPATRQLARLLSKGDDPDLTYLGGTRDYRFYDMAVESAGDSARFTVMVVRTPEGSLRPFVVLATEPAPARG